MKLSILVCSLFQRQSLLDSLYHNIRIQIKQGDYHDFIEVLTEIDNGEESTGKKRNELLERAKGDYVCFIDDDDEISPNYINILLEAIKTNPDCVSLRGVMTTSGQNPLVFEHSIKYAAYATKEPDQAFKQSPSWVKAVWEQNRFVTYERYPNHLNCIRASIAKQFKFPEINHGEDTNWATQIFNSGLIKTEFYTDEILYYYRYNPIK